ncbi:MAG: hypothetical protein QGG67_16460 [Gammaproteobacteria bacterium]|jgi:hypothetical protein|nr:hypothetical protein [Gammaproteobacteria bacterium]|tara:strand:- start:10213 stop:10917 length:705 start_codon:yes stop_codon:yes gene_type:complete
MFERQLKATRAAAEVLLIALGILLGLMAESWLEQRGERAREREYLETLTIEFANVRDELASLVATENARIELGEDLIRVSLTGEELPGESILERLNDFHYYSFTVPPTVAVDQLIATGELSLISSSSVRQTLTRWHSRSQVDIGLVQELFMDHWSHVGREFWSSSMNMSDLYLANSERDLGIGTSASDQSRMFGTPEFRNWVAGRLMHSYDVNNIYINLLGIVESVQVELVAAQ